MKKITAFLLIMVVIFSLAACGDNEIPSLSDNTTEPSYTTTMPNSTTTTAVTTTAVVTTTTATVPTEEEQGDTVPSIPGADVQGLTYNIPPLFTNVKDITAATIHTFNGNITKENQVDVYNFTPVRDGVYTFQITELMANVVLEMYVYNSLGQQLGCDVYVSNNDHLTLELKANQTYTCKIYQDSGFAPYILNIGEQPPTVDLTPYSAVNDSVVFVGQKNLYTFTPERDGRYTFSISELKSGIVMEMYVYNRLGETMSSDSYLENNNYIALDLKGGNIYTIAIYQSSKLGTYTLNVGRQKPTTNVVVGATINDSIEFDKQINVYTFTATSATHMFKLVNTNSSIVTEIDIINYLDETLATDVYFNNGKTLTAYNLTPGQEYTINVYQDSKFGNYTLTVK